MSNRVARLATAVALAAASSIAASAPVTYNIEFGAPAPGTATPSGSFVYDGALATNQQFLSFTVLIDGRLFDIAGAANAFQFRTDVGYFHTSCMTPAVNDAFELLTNAPCVAAVATRSDWSYASSRGFSDFTLGRNSGSGSNEATDRFGVSGEDSRTDAAHAEGSSFVAVAVPSAPGAVPEPDAAALAGIGVVALLAARRRNGSQQG